MRVGASREGFADDIRHRGPTYAMLHPVEGATAPRLITPGEIEVVVGLYRDSMARYEEAASVLEHRLRRELRAAAIKTLVLSRAKHPDEVRRTLVDLPMGIGFTPTYTRHRFQVSPGDRMLLITDGVLETASPDDTLFGTRVVPLLNSETGNCEDLARRLLTALHDHAACDELAHDDVTFLLAEFVDGPPGPALWHVLKHRLLRQGRR